MPENELTGFAGISGALHTFHIFIASSAGHIVKTIVPSGPRQLWPTAPACAATLSRRRRDGNACTVMLFVSGLGTASGRPCAVRGARGSQLVPCVLNSSFACGDHCRLVIAVCSGSTCSGCAIGDVALVLKTRIWPSGYVEPVASRSGCQGHQESAWDEG